MAQMHLMSILYRAIGFAGLAAMLPGCGGGSAAAPSSPITAVGGTATSSLPTTVVNNVATSSVSSSPSPTSSPEPASAQAAITGVIVQAGDSIGVGLGADWAAIDHLGFPSSVIIHNVSVSGKAMQTGYGYRAFELYPYRNSTAPSVLLIQQGTNDLYYGSSGTALHRNILTPFVADARKAGFYVVVDTILPRSDSGWTPIMESERIAYNNLVRGNRAGADAINDLAADPEMGDGSSYATSGLYADGAHPSLAGQQRLAVLNAMVLAPFLQRAVRPLSR